MDGLPRPRPARPAVALLLRRRLGARPASRTSTTMAADARRASRPARRRAPATATSSRSPSGCTRSPSASSSGSRSRASGDMIDLKTNMSASTPVATCWPADGHDGRGHGAEARARRPRRADARPLHPVRRLVARRLARRALRHRPHADGRRASGTRWAAPARCRWRWRSWPRELGVEFRPSTERPPHRHAPGQARRRRRDRRRARRSRCDAVVSNMDAVRTYRELLGGDIGAQVRAPPQARAGLLRRRALPRPRPRLRPSGAPRLRLLPRPARGVRLRSTARASRRPTRPATSRPPPGTEPGVAPPGGEALYVLVHTPYLRPHHDWKRMLPEYRRVILDKLKRTGGMTDIEEPHRVRARADAAGHPRPLPRAERRDLRAGQPRPVLRRVQAGQPVAATSRACTSPAARPIRGRACRWC